jgi:hypothetical protein
MTDNLKTLKTALSVLCWSLVGADIPESGKSVQLDKVPFYFGSLSNYIKIITFTKSEDHLSKNVSNVFYSISDNVSLRIEELLDQSDYLASKELLDRLYNFQSEILRLNKELSKNTQ